MDADTLTVALLQGQAAVCAALVLTAGLAGLGVVVLVTYLHAAVRAS